MNMIDVLVATMNRNDTNFINDLNLKTNAVIVNQNKKNNKKIIHSGENTIKLISSDKKGLSNSRNLAIKNSEADICLIADDDITYNENYEKIVLDAYQKHPEADIIVFQVTRYGGSRTKKYDDKTKWLNYLSCLKVSSVEITFKRSSIVDNNIKFNTLMGSGAEFYLGEENIFLYDSLKKGLKILYKPIDIAKVDVSESSWFEGYNTKYFNSLGAAFYNMSNNFYLIFILQAVIRKRKLFSKDYSLINVVKEMLIGVKMYKKSKGKLND